MPSSSVIMSSVISFAMSIESKLVWTLAGDTRAGLKDLLVAMPTLDTHIVGLRTSDGTSNGRRFCTNRTIMSVESEIAQLHPVSGSGTVTKVEATAASSTYLHGGPSVTRIRCTVHEQHADTGQNDGAQKAYRCQRRPLGHRYLHFCLLHHFWLIQN